MFNVPHYSIIRATDGRTFGYSLHGDSASDLARGLSLYYPNVAFVVYRHGGTSPKAIAFRAVNGRLQQS
jgi:hypothetical protein